MMTPLWSLADIAAVCGVHSLGKDGAITGVQFDSRAVKPGDLFIAMPGSFADGHAYVAAAATNGAVAALVKEVQAGVDIPQLVVPDVPVALGQLAQAARLRFRGPVVAVGGSVGKTTTTAMLAALLNAHAPQGSLNNHVGVPLTMVRLPQPAPAFVAEVGTNAPGEVAPLAKLVQPQVALITNVVEEHLEGLGSLEAVRLEELSIVQGLPADGTLVVPEGLDLQGSGWVGKVLRFNPAQPLACTIQEPTIARIACANAALAVVQALGVTPDAAALQRLAAVEPGSGRGQVAVVNDITLIDDSYNANPASMGAALQALATRPGRRKIAIVGDMRELGPQEAEFHRALAPQLKECAGVVLVGPLMQHLRLLLPVAQVWESHPNPDDFRVETLAARLQPGDVVLVKGSKSITYTRGFASKLKAALQQHA